LLRFGKIKKGLVAWIFLNYHITLKGVLNPNFRPFSFELKKKIDFLK